MTQGYPFTKYSEILSYDLLMKNKDDRKKMGFVENAYLEFKRAEGVDKDGISPKDLGLFAKEACAFANTQGGILMLGINDDGSPNWISDIDAYVDQLRRKGSDKLDPPLVDYEVELIRNEENKKEGVCYVIVKPSKHQLFRVNDKNDTKKHKNVYVRSSEGSYSVPWVLVTKMLTGEKVTCDAEVLATICTIGTSGYQLKILIRNTSLLSMNDVVLKLEPLSSDIRNKIRISLALDSYDGCSRSGGVAHQEGHSVRTEKIRPQEKIIAMKIEANTKDLNSLVKYSLKGYLYCDNFRGIEYSITLSNYDFSKVTSANSKVSVCQKYL